MARSSGQSAETLRGIARAQLLADRQQQPVRKQLRQDFELARFVNPRLAATGRPRDHDRRLIGIAMVIQRYRLRRRRRKAEPRRGGTGAGFAARRQARRRSGSARRSWHRDRHRRTPALRPGPRPAPAPRPCGIPRASPRSALRASADGSGDRGRAGDSANRAAAHAIGRARHSFHIAAAPPALARSTGAASQRGIASLSANR